MKNQEEVVGMGVILGNNKGAENGVKGAEDVEDVGVERAEGGEGN